ncbi:alpha/beta hydrolase [Stutzerimonas stutzeri]|uniref:Alpha/beta hydrolase n=1 Tax=Stutzerimonas stutzeri TaxID=316 RepID=W8RWI1_STUST|nr:alpha/beta fold hydrolase [Stutzerimonas stutzeri]AHL76456.1 alpha/beta hydrolase [Stutzerimonas stutzeri]MCQ4329689.1 alpha/beta fold hydrolase [Stutzerimonas stutzeri]
MTQNILLQCRDGYQLAAQLWQPPGEARGSVIISSATGVLARYYARYAGFLCEQGYAVLTYDYRGIGGSRPASLRRSRIRWRDWGDYDFDAAVRWMRERDPNGLLVAVGHSIGGFLPGFSRAAPQVDRFLSVGAQYAYWRDYAAAQRWQMYIRWHLLMPAVTALCGYFPGRRLGWLEDLPTGVALEWAFRRARLESSYPFHERAEVVQRFAAVRAPILAVSMTDDEYGTLPAIERGLSYYRNSVKEHVRLSPADLGLARVGHFDLFHERHRQSFWQATVVWIDEGRNPWTTEPAETPNRQVC